MHKCLKESLDTYWNLWKFILYKNSVVKTLEIMLALSLQLSYNKVEVGWFW